MSATAVETSVQPRVTEEHAVVARVRHSTKGTLVKLILGVHVVAGISLYVYHTITLTPTIFNCPIEAYISIGVIACLHIYSFM